MASQHESGREIEQVPEVQSATKSNEIDVNQEMTVKANQGITGNLAGTKRPILKEKVVSEEYVDPTLSKRPTQQTTRRESKNTAIFVSGLPEDTTLDELVDYFIKYGVIMDDMFTGGPRIKMYEEDGQFKGECLIVYLREESAIMASDLLDGSYFRPEISIKVERASFQPTDRPDNERRAVDKKVWRQHMQSMSKKLEWTTNDAMSPEEEAALQAELRKREKYQRIVILRGMFTQSDTEDARFALDLKEELLEECEKLGEVTAIHVLKDLFLCTVKFREKEAAAACIKLMNGRYFDGKRINAIYYDGSFSLKESKDDADGDGVERLEKFGEWLEHVQD
jgi:HIV Tat-specific factor 1